MSYKEERRKYWEEVMKEWKASGLSGAAFCREVGCSKANFFRWKKKFSDEVAESGAFVPVNLKTSSTESLRVLIGEDIEIRLKNCSSVGHVIDALRKVC